MMAAGRAGARGKRVLLLEKNPTPGKKLLITGGGRSNITNDEQDDRKLLPMYGDAEQFLYSAFAQFSVSQTLEFFHGLGMETKVEPGCRVFPSSDTAQSVWDVLHLYMKQGGVSIRNNCRVRHILIKDMQITGILLESGETLTAGDYILATGGTSRPDTGSTGDGFQWARDIGHSVRDEGGSLVPMAIKDEWAKDLQGVSLPKVKITVHADGEKIAARKGKMLFTHFGLSGPVILNLSNLVGQQLLAGKSVLLFIDVVPDLDPGQLNLGLNDLFRTKSNRLVKNVLDEFVPNALIPHLLSRAEIDEKKFAHSVTREERLKLASAAKNLCIEVDKLLGKDKSVVTSGGVSLEEIDMKTMRSRLVNNLFLVGDMLDIDRPSGGYSLQLCWTTGWVAGSHAGDKKKSSG